MKVRKEVVVTFAWVTRPADHTKGAKDEVKRPEGLQLVFIKRLKNILEKL